MSIDFKIIHSGEIKHFITEIKTLYSKSFSGSIDEKYLNWLLFSQNSFASVAFDGNKLVSFLIASEENVESSGTIIKGLLFNTIMTLPEYRGKGLMVKTAKEAINYAKLCGFYVISCFPNFSSHRILNAALGFTTIYEIPRLQLAKNASQSFSTNDKIKSDNDFLLFYSERQYKAEGFTNFYTRDQDFFKWRFLNKPQSEYENYVIESDGSVMANIVLRIYKNELNIVDIQYNSEKEALALIEFTINRFHSSSFEVLTVWCPANSKIHRVFEKYNFRNQYPIVYFDMKIINEKLNKKDLLNYHNWFVNCIDDNIY